MSFPSSSDDGDATDTADSSETLGASGNNGTTSTSTTGASPESKTPFFPGALQTDSNAGIDRSLATITGASAAAATSGQAAVRNSSEVMSSPILQSALSATSGKNVQQTPLLNQQQAVSSLNHNMLLAGNVGYMQPYLQQYSQLSTQPQQAMPYPIISIPQGSTSIHRGMLSSPNPQNSSGGAAFPLVGQGTVPFNQNSQASTHSLGGFSGANPYVPAQQQQHQWQPQQHNHIMAVNNPGVNVQSILQSILATNGAFLSPMNLNLQLAPGAAPAGHVPLQALQMQAAAAAGGVVGRSPPQASPSATQNVCIRLALPYDKERLSPYQVLAREQMECFSASQDDVEAYARGRNKQIMIGQVGIRCLHCKHLPMQDRGRGSVYFPGRLLFLYQAAQNLAACHLCESCPSIPPETKKKLQELHANRATNGGGKIYWAEAAAVVGLIDAESGIRFGVMPDMQDT